MSDNKNYLGWGIIGTPKGRQAVGAGADLSLNLAKSFDLSQDFGACLPEPKLKDFTPLYSVALQRSGNYAVLGFAEYRPVYEQGQRRAGTYFGAFIESVNTQINENSAQTLLESLFELSKYQMQHFIDTQSVAYKESIHGKNVPEPSKLLQIAQALQPLTTNILSQTPTEETLYIQCRQRQAVNALQAVLREQLFYRFKQIFFSESDHISAQVQKKPSLSPQIATEYGLEIVEGKIQPKAGVESPTALKERIARLEKSLTETPKATIDESAIIGDFMRATCEANPKDGKKIDVHNRYADRYGKKLCP